MTKKELKELNKSNIRPQDVDCALERFNYDNEGFGVEAYFNHNFWENHYFQNIRVLYVNMGDSYTETLFYCVKRRRYYLGDIEKIMRVCGSNLSSR
jgi:hypothetical protein